jgi:hypothetical protein
MGFSTFKRDEFEIVIDEYFRKVHQVSIMLTGIEIEELKYSLSSKNCNQNRSKIKLLNCLDAIRYGSCVTEFRNL